MKKPTSGTTSGATQAQPGTQGQALPGHVGALAGQHIATAVADAECFDAAALLRHATAVQVATRNEAARHQFCVELLTTLQVLALKGAPACERIDAH